MVSKSGHASRFNEEQVRPMGRDTSGVKGMNVAGKDNRVLAMDVARDDTELFVVTENGYGKRTPVSEYPVKGRGTKGVLTAKLTEKKGGLAGALIVARAPGAALHLPERHGPADLGLRDLADGPRDPGREGDEHQGRRRVSAVALVVESEGETPPSEDPPADELPPVEEPEGVGMEE